MNETLVAGGISIMPPTAEDMQLSMLLWGDSGSGKTTLAATAPGIKLYLLFDPNGDLSLAGRSDVLVLNLSW
jgi:energy-coupling factor transporter ATP-binding protein EcfA2